MSKKGDKHNKRRNAEEIQRRRGIIKGILIYCVDIARRKREDEGRNERTGVNHHETEEDHRGKCKESSRDKKREEASR